MPRTAPALVAAALLVLAGCAAPTAETGGGDAATTAAPGIEYRGGSLPFAAAPLFDRVQSVLGTAVPAPAYVRVVDDPADLPGSVAGGGVPRFWRIAGVDAESGLSAADVDRLENGATSRLGYIVVYPGQNATDADRWVVVHEFVHYVQFQRGVGSAVARSVAVDTTDGAFVRRSVLEGAAVFATDAYVERHAPERPPNAALYRDLNRTLNPGSVAWHFNRAYVDGRAYVASRVADPTALGVVYREPPRTSEQVIHGLAPGVEPPAPLNLTVDGGRWRVAATDRLGEAFVRTALAADLGAGRASAAAAGWGTDALRTFRRPGARNGSFAWTLRWDGAAEAGEFAAAMRDALAARGERAGDGWRVAGVRVALRRPGPATTVLLAGNASFVRGTSVRADGASVTVDAP